MSVTLLLPPNEGEGEVGEWEWGEGNMSKGKAHPGHPNATTQAVKVLWEGKVGVVWQVGEITQPANGGSVCAWCVRDGVGKNCSQDGESMGKGGGRWGCVW